MTGIDEEQLPVEARLLPNPYSVGTPIEIDEDLCTRCNRCAKVCHTNIIFPDVSRERVPLVAYPDECWLCGACVEHCPVPGAIALKHPLGMRIGWRRKDTGEFFRVGGKSPVAD